MLNGRSVVSGSMTAPPITVAPKLTVLPSWISVRFTFNVMRRVPEDIRLSLSEEQLEALRETIYTNRPLASHPIDVRGVIPLFFARFNYVLLVGLDRRSRAWRPKRSRPPALKGGMIVIGVLSALGPLLLLVLLCLYILKASLGIDLFPDQNLSQFLGLG